MAMQTTEPAFVIVENQLVNLWEVLHVQAVPYVSSDIVKLTFFFKNGKELLILTAAETWRTLAVRIAAYYIRLTEPSD